MTADERVEALMEAAMGSWKVGSLCGARIEARIVPEFTADLYPKLAKTEAHARRNI